MWNNINTSIFLSIFRRKGAEGDNTKIFDDNNAAMYQNVLTGFEPEEKAMILCYWDNLNWTVLTNMNLRFAQNGAGFIIGISEIKDVKPALLEEYNMGVTNKRYFSLLKVTGKNQEFILNLEMGMPYAGFFQVLHYISSNNK